MQVNSRTRLCCAAVGGIVAAMLLADTALAARQSGTLLRVFGQTDSDSMSITVMRESTGSNTVTLFGVPNVADGTSFSGVDRIDIFPGGRSDSLEMFIESEALQVNVTKTTREFNGSIFVTTPPEVTDVALGFNFVTGTRSDNVKMEVANGAANFALDVGFDFGTRSSGLSILVENLIEASADISVTGDGGTEEDSFEFIGKGPGLFTLSGSPGVEECKVEVEGDLGGAANLACQMKTEMVVKGDLVGAPRLTAFQATLSVDGAITGFPTVLAGQCSIDPLTANVTTNGCEFR